MSNPQEKHILLALDLAGVEIEYIDNIGKIWRATNNVAMANSWALEVRIYRTQCPEIKQRPSDKVSDTDIRQAIASMLQAPGGDCNVLEDLADSQLPPGRTTEYVQLFPKNILTLKNLGLKSNHTQLVVSA